MRPELLAFCFLDTRQRQTEPSTTLLNDDKEALTDTDTLTIARVDQEGFDPVHAMIFSVLPATCSGVALLEAASHLTGIFGCLPGIHYSPMDGKGIGYTGT